MFPQKAASPDVLYRVCGLVVVLTLLCSCSVIGDRAARNESDPTTPALVSTPTSRVASSHPPTTTTSTVHATLETAQTTAIVTDQGGFIAYIGCSQTKLSVRGYEDLGGTRLERYETAGGQVNLWSRDGGGYWAAFDEAVSGKAITAGWMEICITGGNERNTTYEDILDALAVFRSRIPDNAPIYVSGLELFEPIGSCRIAGPTIPAITREYADRLVEAGLALRGPDLGPLTPESTTDGCHPNRIGQELVGRQLLTFFGS